MNKPQATSHESQPAAPRRAGATPPETTAPDPAVKTPPETTAPDPAVKTPPAAGPADQYQVLQWADKAGRQFQEYRSRMGLMPEFTGAFVIEKQWPDGVGARQQVVFPIPGTCIDEVFANYDAAREAARLAADADMESQHTRAVLSGQVPMPQRPIKIHPRGKRIVH